MSSDGPKNSQGYIRNLAAAGMTERPYWQQLLEYTDGEWTREVANKFINEATKEDFAEVFGAFPPCLPPELREALVRRLKWLRCNPKEKWDMPGWKIDEGFYIAFGERL